MVYPLDLIEGKPALGFYRARSHDLITTELCLIEPHPGGRLRALIPELMIKHGISIYDEKTHTGDLRFVTLRVTPNSSEADGQPKQMVILTSRLEKDAYFCFSGRPPARARHRLCLSESSDSSGQCNPWRQICSAGR